MLPLAAGEDIVLAADMQGSGGGFRARAVWTPHFERTSDLMESRFRFVRGSAHTLTVTLEQVAVWAPFIDSSIKLLCVTK